MQVDLHGSTVLVTGGTRGIGRALVEAFAEAGAHVAFTFRSSTDAAAALVESLEEQGTETLSLQGDVADLDAAEAHVNAVTEHFGSLDVLVNNAGITRDATLKKMSEEDFDRVVDVNLKGVFNCTKAAVPVMAENGGGRVLNAASIVGRYGNFGQTNYVATKSGVIGMTKTWARELGRDQITVNAVAPGFIDTAMVETVPEKVIGRLEDQTPLGRLGNPEDIANAYLFLASDDAAFITGSVLAVDGGLVL